MMNNVNYRQSMFISDMKTFDSAIHDFHSYVEWYIESLLRGVVKKNDFLVVFYY